MMINGINQLPAPLFVPKGHFDPSSDLVGTGDVPSGKPTVCKLENHHVSWVKQRTQWPFSIAMLVYQRVVRHLIFGAAFSVNPGSNKIPL